MEISKVIFNLPKHYKEQLIKMCNMMGVEENRIITLTDLIIETLVKEFDWKI
jgi:hypothetical protein